jgi:CheY-like chemotaxis protein
MNESSRETTAMSDTCPAWNLSGVRVLIVEDSTDSRELLGLVFEFRGAHVRTAASAEEGKRLLYEECPDVVVSDIAMPGPGDGIDVVRAVKALADARGLHIPVIAITAQGHRRRELLAEGFVDLVEKPLDPIALCGVVRRHAQFRE